MTAGAPAVGLGVLVRAARTGDETAFAALVRMHQDRAFAVALRMTGDSEDARDAVQEALLHAWRGLPDYREDASFGTWFIRIVINRCHNLSRARCPTVPLPEYDLADPAPAVEDLVEQLHRHEATLTAILALPSEQRAALVLHALGGLSHADVGRALSTTESAAKVRVHRARRVLTETLQEWA